MFYHRDNLNTVRENILLLGQIENCSGYSMNVGGQFDASWMTFDATTFVLTAVISTAPDVTEDTYWWQVDILVLLPFCLAGSRLFWQAQPPQGFFGLFWGRLLAQVGAPLSSLIPNGTSAG